MTAERLDLEMGRLQVDMTRDLGQLRLKYEQMGDPDAIDTQWPADIKALKESYLNGKTDTGRARVDPRLRDRWELGFDDLANKHALAVGTNALALRQSQRVANYIDYRHEAGGQAAATDPDTRDTLYAQHRAYLEGLAEKGVITPEEVAADDRKFRADTENAFAICLIGEDPQGLLRAIQAGDLSNLSPEEQARYTVRAESALAAEAEKNQRAADQAQRERDAAVATELGEAIRIVRAGGTSSIEALTEDPAVEASHPDLVSELRGAAALRDNQIFIDQMTPAQLEALSTDLGGKDATKVWHLDAKKAVDTQLQAARKGYATDGIAFAKSVGLSVPEIDFSDPARTAATLAKRLTFAQAQAEKGYTKEVVILSEAERKELGAIIDPKADPAARVQIAAAMMSGLKGSAGAVARSSGAGPVFGRAIDMMADGVDAGTVQAMLRGEQKLELDTALAPPLKDRLMLFNELTGDLFAGDAKNAAGLMAAATALYADDMGTIDPEDIANGVFSDGPARDKMLGAVQTILGASPDADGQMTIGGVQEIKGEPLVLPRGVAAFEAERALDMVGLALAGYGPLREVSRGIGATLITRSGDGAPATPQADLPEVDQMHGLKAASLVPDQAPNLGADPSALWSTLRIEKVPGPLGQDAYVLVGERRGIPYYVEDQEGRTYAFSMERLIGGVRQ